MAWSPLGGGRLFADDDQAAARLRPVLAALGAKYATAHGPASAAQLALAWVLAHPSRPVALLGTSRLDRLEQAARACVLPLERHDWYWLWSAAQGRGLP
jgi:predicted oxidoreductase